MEKKNENKEKLVSVRMTKDEYDILQKKAKAQGITLSAVIIGAVVKQNTINTLMTRNAVTSIKNISSGCKGLKDDYYRLRNSGKKEDWEECMERINAIEMEMGELWQSLR